MTPAAAPPSTELDSLRTQMAENVADLIFLAQDVSLSIASVNCPSKEQCPLYIAAKQLAQKVQEFLRMQRQALPRRVG